MTTLATATIENKSKSLFIKQPKYKFTKIEKDLHKLMMVGCSKCSAAAYQTYSYCISMHPDSIITPAKIAASLKSFSDQTGGKALSERTIRRHLAMLEKVDLVEREYLRDKDGQFLGGIWRFFSLSAAGQKGPMDGSDDNQPKSKKKIDEKPEKPVGQKGPPVLNKERARVCKTNSKTKSSSSAETDRRPAAAASFPTEIEAARTNGPPISAPLVSMALRFGEDYVLAAIEYARRKNPENPGGVFRGAAEERYTSIDAKLRAVEAEKEQALKARRRYNADLQAIEQRSAEYHKETSKKLNKYVELYQALEPAEKQRIFDNILSNTRIPFIQKEITEKGVDGFHQVAGMKLKIKLELGYRKL